MPLFLLEGTATNVSTMEGVYAFIRQIMTAVITLLGSLYTTITTTPLLMIVVVLSFGGGLVLFAIGILHRLGVGSSGKRRRGRR